MKVSGIDIAQAIIDGLEIHCTTEDYYKMNHLSAQQIERIGEKISVPIREALNAEGITTI